MVRWLIVVMLLTLIGTGCRATKQYLVLEGEVDGIDVRYVLEGELGYDPQARKSR